MHGANIKKIKEIILRDEVTHSFLPSQVLIDKGFSSGSITL